MYTSIFIISSIMQAVVTFNIYKKGHKNLSYLLFFIISIVTWCWVFANYLSVVFLHESYLIYIVRFIMLLAVIQTCLFYLFAQKFPSKDWNKLDLRFINYLGFALITSLVAISPYMFKSVAVIDGVIHMQVQPGIVVFITFIGFSVINAFKVLFNRFRTSAGLKRTQLLILFFAATINWIIIPLTNFVLTLTLKNLLFVKASPIYGLLFSSVIAYALVRHHLFDVKKALRDSIIHVSYYLRNRRNKALQYYMFQSLVYGSSSNHITLDFSDVKDLDNESVILFNYLRNYMKMRGKNIYFIGYTEKVFKQLYRA